MAKNHTEVVQAFAQAAEDLHHLHLNTLSYARHMALNEAYDTMHDFKDLVAEALIAREGKLAAYKLLPIPSIAEKDAFTTIYEVATLLKEYATAKGYGDLVNKADDVTALGARIEYLFRLD